MGKLLVHQPKLLITCVPRDFDDEHRRLPSSLTDDYAIWRPQTNSLGIRNCSLTERRSNPSCEKNGGIVLFIDAASPVADGVDYCSNDLVQRPLALPAKNLRQ